MLQLRPIALAVLVLVLGACRPEAAAPADPGATGPLTQAGEQAAAEPDARPPSAGEFRIVSVLLGPAVDADKVVTADSADFARKDAFHASVLSTGASQGVRLSATWLAPDGRTIAESVQALVPSSSTATTFSISNPKSWPAGSYQLLIGIDGQTQRTRKFEVR